jgi:Menin
MAVTLLHSHGPRCAAQVAEDHCWLSLDGTGERTSAAEVATASQERQGMPPSAALWASWLYSGGQALVCNHGHVVAAVVTSMDTCVGDRAKDDSDDARALQRALLRAVADAEPSAMYANACCVLGELEQDEVLEAARAATAQGAHAEAVRGILQGLQRPFARMLSCFGHDIGGFEGATAGPWHVAGTRLHAVNLLQSLTH